MNRVVHRFVTGFMSSKVMYGQKFIMSIEVSITAWVAMPSNNEMSREDLFVKTLLLINRSIR